MNNNNNINNTIKFNKKNTGNKEGAIKSKPFNERKTKSLNAINTKKQLPPPPAMESVNNNNNSNNNAKKSIKLLFQNTDFEKKFSKDFQSYNRYCSDFYKFYCWCMDKFGRLKYDQNTLIDYFTELHDAGRVSLHTILSKIKKVIAFNYESNFETKTMSKLDGELHRFKNGRLEKDIKKASVLSITCIRKFLLRVDIYTNGIACFFFYIFFLKFFFLHFFFIKKIKKKNVCFISFVF